MSFLHSYLFLTFIQMCYIVSTIYILELDDSVSFPAVYGENKVHYSNFFTLISKWYKKQQSINNVINQSFNQSANHTRDHSSY